MKRIAGGQAFDREDVRAVAAQRKRETGIDAPADEEDRAGAALAAIAALLGAGEIEALAQEIEQRDSGIIEIDVAPHAVDGEADGEIHGSQPPIGGVDSLTHSHSLIDAS